MFTHRMEDNDDLQITLLDDELHFAIITREGHSPIPVDSVLNAVGYNYPHLNLYKRMGFANEINSTLMFFLGNHEINERRKQFHLIH